MTISEKNTRVVLTMPKFEAEAFRQDAEALGLTLSKYAYLLLMSWSKNVPEAFRDYANEYLGMAQDTPEAYMRFAEWCEKHPKE